QVGLILGLFGRFLDDLGIVAAVGSAGDAIAALARLQNNDIVAVPAVEPDAATCGIAGPASANHAAFQLGVDAGGRFDHQRIGRRIEGKVFGHVDIAWPLSFRATGQADAAGAADTTDTQVGTVDGPPIVGSADDLTNQKDEQRTLIATLETELAAEVAVLAECPAAG